jgi:hypothetical protein
VPAPSAARPARIRGRSSQPTRSAAPRPRPRPRRADSR